MLKLLALALALVAPLSHAAIEVVSPETWTLYRGTSIVQPRVSYASKAACEAAAALDVAGFVCFAIKAKTQLGLPTALAQQRLAEMKATALRDFQLWTRTATWLPKHRVNPPRKFNWMVHGYHELRVGGCD